LLSVIIPAYNEEEIIPKTASVINKILSEAQIPHELLFINDGSRDSTWEKIEEQSRLIDSVKGVCFSRNFGKESAIFAGIAQCKGDCCVVIDCDLQHPPEKIVEMYRLWEQGYEIVEGVKSDRGKESGLHRFAANTFYGIMSSSVGFDMSRASDFKLLDRKAINVLLNMNEKNAFFRALSSWIGFKSTEVEYEVQEREAGVSKWSTMSLIKYALTNITSFTSAPMQIVTILGLIVFVVGLATSIEAVVRFIQGTAQAGFTTVIILQCFTGSFIMIGLGIIGFYISKIYDEVKGRPKFIIDKTVGD
jgi:dolichol-phosphate mannosyltransferase